MATMHSVDHKACISKCSLTSSLSLSFCTCLIGDLFVSIEYVREFTPHQQLTSTHVYENITQNAPTGSIYLTQNLVGYLMQFQNSVFCVDQNNERIEHCLILYVSHSLSVFICECENKSY